MEQIARIERPGVLMRLSSGSAIECSARYQLPNVSWLIGCHSC